MASKVMERTQDVVVLPATNGAHEPVDAPSHDLEIDVDLITIEAFLEMLEIQERIRESKDTPKAADMRALFNILGVAVVGVDVKTLPYRYLNVVMQEVTEAFSVGIDPN